MSDLIPISNLPATHPDAASYLSLFPDDQARCAPGALMANNSRLAYLVHLKEMILAFETRADVSAPVTLKTRRADLLDLKLDERTTRTVLPKLRMVLDLLERRARDAVPAHQSLQVAVAQGTHHANVPFNHAWESIKAVLAIKQAPLWDVLCQAHLDAPAFVFDQRSAAGMRSATQMASGFSPELQHRLLTGSDDQSLSVAAVGTTHKLVKALGLTRRELRRLLAVASVGEDGSSVTGSAHVPSAPAPSSQHYGAAFINDGATPLYLTEQRSRAPGPKKKVTITGFTQAHLDRLQHSVRLQRALELDAAQTDSLVMAALHAEGQRSDYHLTAHTLRALGMFRHLHAEYEVEPDQYAAFLHQISPYATERHRPFYDRIFVPEVKQQDAQALPVLTLDDSEFDSSAIDGVDALTLKQLALALRVDDSVLRVVLGWVTAAQQLTKPKRSLAVVSACYRVVALARLMHPSTVQALTLLDLLMQDQPVYRQQLAGVPRLAGDDQADIVDVIAGALQAGRWLQHVGLEPMQLASVLNAQVVLPQSRWENAVSVHEGDDDSALDLTLSKALGLEGADLIDPLLRWAGVDRQQLGQAVRTLSDAAQGDSVEGMTFTDEDRKHFSTLQRYSDAVKLFKFSAQMLEQLVQHPARFDLQGQAPASHRGLDLTCMYQLSLYKALIASLAPERYERDVLAYLAAVNDDPALPTDQAWAALEQLLDRPAGSLSCVISLTPPTTLRELDHLMRTLDIAKKHHWSLDSVLQLVPLTPKADYDVFEQAAVALRKGCSSEQRKALAEHMGVAWRDALMHWMLVHWVPQEDAGRWITSPQALADYLLIDLQVSHEPMITRTLSAIASLQRYLHQIHSRVENGYRHAAISEVEREEWEAFSSSYDRWKLRRDAQNEPQNYIDPTRRQRKTTAFKDLEMQLAQGKCQPEDIQAAMLGYLSAFEKVSNIQPVSVYADGTSPLTDMYHFIGKTNVEPIEYYWRTLDMAQRDQDGAPSMLAWGEWEKITLTARGQITQTPLPAASATQAGHSLHAVDTVRPVIIAGRRYVVWVERDISGIPMGGDNKPSVFHALRVCFSFQQTDGIWSPPNTFMTLDGHDRTGKFDDASVPDVYQHGAKGNQFLKTREFMPGLMVMVNIKGDRLDDPWLTVLLFDAAADAPMAPKPDVDYFIATKDLLLIEDKRLDTDEKTDRPIEARLVKQWLKFFRDPRVAQHPYMGAVSTLRYEEEGSSPFKWSLPADQGTANASATLADDGKSIVVNVDMNAILKADSRWKIYTDVKVTPVDPESTPKLFFIRSDCNSCSKSNIDSADTVIEDTASEIYKKRIELNNTLVSLTAQHKAAEDGVIYTNLREKEDPKLFKERLTRAENKRDNLKSQKESAESALDRHLTKHYRVVKFDLSDKEILEDISFATLRITFTTPTKKTAVADYSNDSNYSPTIVVQNIFTPSSWQFKHSAEQWIISLPALSTVITLFPPFAKLAVRLTVNTVGDDSPTWTLSSQDRTLLNGPILSEFEKVVSSKSSEAILLRHQLLTTRYLPTNFYNSIVGRSTTGASTSSISVTNAIQSAVANRDSDAINRLIELEFQAVRQAGVKTQDAVLKAALRLRHLHPDAFSRIVLYLNPAHTLTFEDSVIADGHGALRFICPVNLDVRKYSATLEVLPNSEESSQRWVMGSATYIYTLEEKDDDAVPSVHIRRNDEQAVYLDFMEAASGAEPSLALPYHALRLNTLFGKRLVALATQSVEQALSWKAQTLHEPSLDTPDSTVMVDLRSANGLYFWELFFHVPFLVTWLQRQNREYRQAWRWCTRQLFDPYRVWTPAGNHPPLFWLARPLLARAAYIATAQTNDPDLLAYAEPERYRKALHLFVIECWQRQGDDHYRALTLDSLVEAALCYDRALRLIGALPEDLSSAPAQALKLSEADPGAFTPPLNIRLVEVRNLLRNRLFNLRHGLTLDGKPAAILLDPDTLDQLALGQTGPGRDQPDTSRVARAVPPCRYDEVRQCAGEAVLQLIELGQTQLRFYESEAAVKLSVASKQNVIRLLEFPCRLQEQALELARRERDTLMTSRQMVQGKHAYYQGLYDEGITDLEHASRAFAYMSQAALGVAEAFEITASAVESTLPTIYGTAVGGNKPSKGVEQGALSFRLLSEIHTMTKDELRLRADYQLRSEQWRFEAEQASFELAIIDKQLLEQDVHLRAASIALEEARAKLASHRAEYEIMTSVFASQPTYLWLIGRMSDIYTSAYDATLSLCLMAESCLQYELGDFDSTWIRTDNWLDNWRGMLAGEALERDLIQMDVAAIRDNHRPLDIRKDFSLCELNGWTKEDLHAHLANHEIHFELAPSHFDVDFPGHYLRRLERIVVEFRGKQIPASTSIGAMLYQTANRVLLSDDSEGATHLYSAKQGNAANVLRDLRPSQRVALWSARELVRNFQLQPSVPDKTRYQPFEGTGLLSSWKIVFAGEEALKGLKKDGAWVVDDIHVQVSYSAVEGSPAFGNHVKSLLAKPSQKGGENAGEDSIDPGQPTPPMTEDDANAIKQQADQAVEKARNALRQAKSDAEAEVLSSPHAQSQKLKASTALTATEQAVQVATQARKAAQAAIAAGTLSAARSNAQLAKQAATEASNAAATVAMARQEAEAAVRTADFNAARTAARDALAAAQKALDSANSSLKQAQVDIESSVLKKPEAADLLKKATEAVDAARKLAEPVPADLQNIGSTVDSLKSDDLDAAEQAKESALAAQKRAEAALAAAVSAAKTSAAQRATAEQLMTPKQMAAAARKLKDKTVIVTRKDGRQERGVVISSNDYNLTLKLANNAESTHYYSQIVEVKAG